jgi:hypothetical protein
VPERRETGEGPLEHRDPVAVEQLRVVSVDATREVREHRERLAGLGEGLARHRDVAHLRVVLGCEVDRERERRDGRILQQCPDAAGDDLMRIAAGTPEVEGVHGWKTGVEQRRHPFRRLVRDLGERDPHGSGGIDQQRSFPTRVMHAREPARSGAPAGRE